MGCRCSVVELSRPNPKGIGRERKIREKKEPKKTVRTSQDDNVLVYTLKGPGMSSAATGASLCDQQMTGMCFDVVMSATAKNPPTTPIRG